MSDEQKFPEKINPAEGPSSVPAEEKTGPRKILDVLDKAQEARDQVPAPLPSPSPFELPAPSAEEDMLIPLSMRRLESLLKAIKDKNSGSS